MSRIVGISISFFLLACQTLPEAEIIVHNGKIVTVDADFSIQNAMAIRNGQIMEIGDIEEIRSFAGNETEWVDLDGKTVLPGLIDSHIHPRAAMTEFDHTIPEMNSVEDVLSYIR